MFRTVCGDVSVASPRFTHCPCQGHETESFSPLAALLPECTTPALRYLETKWASLASYGMTVKLLQDVLPFDEPREPVTIRNHVFKLAERLEDELGDEQVSFIEGCPCDWGTTDTRWALTVGIDGVTSKRRGWSRAGSRSLQAKAFCRFAAVRSSPTLPSSALRLCRPLTKSPSADGSSCSSSRAFR